MTVLYILLNIAAAVLIFTTSSALLACCFSFIDSLLFNDYFTNRIQNWVDRKQLKGS